MHGDCPFVSRRSIGDDVNIFRGVGANPMFELIVVFTVIVQYLIVQVPRLTHGSHKNSVTRVQTITTSPARATEMLSARLTAVITHRPCSCDA